MRLKTPVYDELNLKVNGGEVSGSVLLSRNPVSVNEIATKNYIDTKFSSIPASSFTSGSIPVERLPELLGDLLKTESAKDTFIKSSSVNAGTYTKITVNVKGLVTNGSALSEEDVPNLSWDKITSGKPTTLGGYGITNALPINGGVMGGSLKVNEVTESPSSLINKSYMDTNIPPVDGLAAGGIVYRNSEVTPIGFLRCNGGEVGKTTYSVLYSMIGESFTYRQVKGSGRPWSQQYFFNEDQSTDITGWGTGSNLSNSIHASQVIVTNSRVYLLGGRTGNSIRTVYTAPINADGTLGSWSTGSDLPGTLSQSQVIITKNRVYLLGGRTTGSVSTVYTAVINADGTIGSWATTGSLPGGLHSSQAIVTRNRVYLLGGATGTATSVSTVYTAVINTDGTIGSWTTGVSLPVALSLSQAIVTKNRVYLLGGRTTTEVSTIYTAPINADGTLGAWTTSGNLPGTLQSSHVVVVKNRVYLLGGHRSSPLATVYTAPINVDGTLGVWVTGTPLPGTLSWSQVITTKSKIYLLGGLSGSNVIRTVRVASFVGGSNDYSSFYDGSLSVIDTDKFNLPDIDTKLQSAIAYIKY